MKSPKQQTATYAARARTSKRTVRGHELRRIACWLQSGEITAEYLEQLGGVALRRLVQREVGRTLAIRNTTLRSLSDEQKGE